MTETGDRWYSRPAAWFWCAVALGALVRIYLVVFTLGTSDVEIWERHARDVNELGLIGYYHADPNANHPPFISEAEAFVLRFAEATGIPFRILLRAPFALLDAGTAFLLFLLLHDRWWRFLATAGYWLNPLSIIFSAYHGNTDSAIAFFLALSVWLLANNKVLGAAIAVGVALWVKLPILLAIPALFFFITSWRKRFLFVALAAVVALSIYLPILLQDPRIVYNNIFGYHGLYIQSPGGVPVWGFLRVVIMSMIAPAVGWSQPFREICSFIWEHDWHIVLSLLLLLTWLRRQKRSATELSATIGMLYTIVFGFSDAFTFQYFAWAAPFWFFLRAWFFVPAFLLAAGYIYSLYWFLCGNPWLLGPWDFMKHPDWPPVVIYFRNAAVLFFFVSASVFLFSAIWRKLLVMPAEQRNTEVGSSDNSNSRS